MSGLRNLIVAGVLTFYGAQMQAMEKKAETTSPAETNSQTQEILIFRRGQNGVSRFKIYNNKSYKKIEDGTFFTLSSENGKQLAKDEQGTVYEPTWEIKNSFSNYLISPEKYMAQVDGDINAVKRKISNEKARKKENEEKIKKHEENLKNLEKASQKNVVYDSKGKVKSYDKNLKIALKHLKKIIKNLKKDIKKYDKNVKAFEKQIDTLEAHKKKMQNKLKTASQSKS